MKKKTFIVSHGTYPFDVMVCVGHDHDEVLGLLKKRGYAVNDKDKELLYMDGLGRTTMMSTGATVLRLREFKNNPFHRGILAHEIFHAVEFLFETIGLRLKCDVSGEAFAYQIQYLTEHIYKKL